MSFLSLTNAPATSAPERAALSPATETSAAEGQDRAERDRPEQAFSSLLKAYEQEADSSAGDGSDAAADQKETAVTAKADTDLEETPADASNTSDAISEGVEGMSASGTPGASTDSQSGVGMGGMSAGTLPSEGAFASQSRADAGTYAAGPDRSVAPPSSGASASTGTLERGPDSLAILSSSARPPLQSQTPLLGRADPTLEALQQRMGATGAVGTTNEQGIATNGVSRNPQTTPDSARETGTPTANGAGASSAAAPFESDPANLSPSALKARVTQPSERPGLESSAAGVLPQKMGQLTDRRVMEGQIAGQGTAPAATARSSSPAIEGSTIDRSGAGSGNLPPLILSDSLRASTEEQQARLVEGPGQGRTGKVDQPVDVSRAGASIVSDRLGFVAPKSGGTGSTPNGIALTTGDLSAQEAVDPRVSSENLNIRYVASSASQLTASDASNTVVSKQPAPSAPAIGADAPPRLGPGISQGTLVDLALRAESAAAKRAQINDQHAAAATSQALGTTQNTSVSRPTVSPFVEQMSGPDNLALSVNGSEQGPFSDAALENGGDQVLRAESGSSPQTQLASLGRAQVQPGQTQAVEVARQVMDAIRISSDNRVDVTLQPEELGRLRLSFIQSEQGLVVHLRAENEETLDLMRRHSDLLEQELEEQGYEACVFDFGDGDESDRNDEESGAGARAAEASDARPADLIGNATRLGGAPSDRLDIRI